MVQTIAALESFTVGVMLASWATERLLAGLVGVATVLRVSAFVLGAVRATTQRDCTTDPSVSAQADVALPLLVGLTPNRPLDREPIMWPRVTLS